jgi:NADH-quinone oxidoreductase subunit N
MIISDLNIILPEIILSVYAMLALVGAVYTAKDELATTLCWLTSILFAIVTFWISSDSAAAQTAFNGMFIDDGFRPLCQGGHPSVCGSRAGDEC